MLEALSLGIALLALLVSAFTAWLTLLRRGTVRMTQPTVVWFGPDGAGDTGRKPHPKVFLRTLLYSTADRGQILENMFLTLRRASDTTTFGIRVYGDQALARGSGLFVGKEGVAANHHFLLPDIADYVFRPGEYHVEVFATQVGQKRPRSLWRLTATVPDDAGAPLAAGDAGLYFDWNPEAGRFQPRLDLKPQPLPPPWLADLVK